jgi:hypothetical protein
MHRCLLYICLWVFVFFLKTNCEIKVNSIASEKKAEIISGGKKQRKKKVSRELIREPQAFVEANEDDLNMLKNVLISEKHKLAFCPIEKVAHFQYYIS